MRVAVIGGGPSGLVTLKYLVTAHQFQRVEPIEARLYEAESCIGGTFRYRDYEDAEVSLAFICAVWHAFGAPHLTECAQLVSSKYLTAFSDFRCSPGDADFMSTARYCEYLEAYSTQFNLWPYISLSAKVITVSRHKKEHVIRYSKSGVEENWHCDAIAVCSGLHVKPNIPKVQGIEHISKVLHSSRFKSRLDFGTDKNVLILGCGETAHDLAYLAVTSPTKSITMCHRNGFLYGPKVKPKYRSDAIQLMTSHN